MKKETESVFRMMANTVCIVTTKDQERINGMTAAWVTRVSFVPPLIAVSIGKTRFTHELIERSRIFAVNILTEDQVELSRHFGLKSGRNFDKFASLEYYTGLTGSPILKEAAAYFDCKVISLADAGDHTIFVGEILEGSVQRQAKPLLYNREGYFTLSESLSPP